MRCVTGEEKSHTSLFVSVYVSLSSHSSLTGLDVSGNQLGADGAKHIAPGLKVILLYVS